MYDRQEDLPAKKRLTSAVIRAVLTTKKKNGMTLRLSFKKFKIRKTK